MNSSELREAYSSVANTNFDDVAAELHENAKAKGFYDSLDMTQFNSQAKQLMMLVSECAEIMEALRKSKGEDAVLDECADVLVRLFDFYGALKAAGVVNRSLDEAFENKVGFNKTRPRMHGVLG